MQMTDPLVLPADMLLVPVKDLPQSVREKVRAEEGDYALTRTRSRTPSRIVDAAAADLLKEFRKPATIVEAVIRYSRGKKTDPERILEEAFPLLERLARARLLVPPESEEARRIQPSLEPGAKFAGAEVLRCVQALEDTELYQVKTSEGPNAALKILRSNVGAGVARMFGREAAILAKLEGGVGPALLRDGTDDGRRYLLIEWCSGVECSTAAAELRRSGAAEARRGLITLCTAILDAYTQLHAKNVIHSDIHPRNVLVDGTDRVKIIDFGVARIAGTDNEFRRAHRAGVAFFYEPEYAVAAAARKEPPYSSALGEQYALAALIYFLVTGSYYLDFSLEKHEMLRQIAEDAPLEFARRGAEPWPEVEQVLARALSKSPSDRFPSVALFAEKLKAVTVAGTASLRAPVNNLAAAYPDAQEMLRGVLRRLDAGGILFAGGVAASPKVSVTYGSAGIAYGLYRIACARDDPQLLALADLWATRAARNIDSSDAFYNSDIGITPEIVGRVSPYHTASGVHLVQGLIGQAMGDVVAQQIAVEKFVAAAAAAGCEAFDVTLGRSGILLGATLLLDAVSGEPLVESGALLEFGNRTLNQLWQEIQTFPPLRECREISYSGAAHGWAGILYATMSWCRSSATRLPSGVEERLDQLAEFADRSGRRARWSFRIPRHRRDPMGEYMPGWCNGSAGFVSLWTLAERMLERTDYGGLAEEAGLVAWEAKGQIGNLCCGFAGQAYALLNLYKHTGNKGWLHRAQAQAQLAAHSIRDMPAGAAYQELSMRPESLYKGELGVAVLAAELDRPELAAMPFFEREG